MQVLSNSLDPGEVTKEEVHYLQDKRDGADKCDMIWWYLMKIQIN